MAKQEQPRIGGTGFVLATVAMLWLTMAIAAAAAWPIYRVEQFVWMAVGATLAGTVIAVLGRVLRWAAPVVLFATLGAFLALGVPLAVPSKAANGYLPTLDGIVDLLAGVALGWKRLLTVSLPVGSFESLLVPFFTLILVVTVISLSMALRSRRGELAVVGPALIFVAAILFGPGSASLPVGLSLGLLASALVWVVWIRGHRRRGVVRLRAAEAVVEPSEATKEGRFLGGRAILGAVAILAVASGSSLAAAALLPPKSEREVLRTSIEQPFEPRDFVSPLAGFRKYWQQPTVDSVLLSVRGLPEGARLRIATLDTYDGVVYSVGSSQVNAASGRFARVPYVVGDDADSDRMVTLDVQVERYSGVWVPTLGDYRGITFTSEGGSALSESFYYNDATGTAAVIGTLGQGDRYTIEAVLPENPGREVLRTVDAGQATTPQASGLPAELTLALNGYVGGIEGQGGRLVAMLDGLRADGYISHGVRDDEPPSRSGHATDRLSELLTAQRMIGDAEQYAVLASLMARELGFPSRVVVGFAPQEFGEGLVEIRGSDIAAWIEVHTAQHGWIAVDPTPDIREIPAEEPQELARVSRPQTVVPPPLVESERFDRQATPDIVQDERPSDDPLLALLMGVLATIGWVTLAAAIIVSPFAFIVAAKMRRLWLRRRASSPLERISGGWREFEDAVVDHGFSPPPGSTRSEVAAAVGGGTATRLAAASDRAVFSPREPVQEEAELVWRTVSQLTAALSRGKSPWQRIKAKISLRSLGGYSVTRLFWR